ncbi:MAG: oxidoreductase [Desulfobacterales bacterium]|nr:oxidoreductase [Desulfobacterales bacterium]
MPQKAALLLGGSGLTGGHCLEYLLNDAHYNQVVALVRRPLPVEHPKLIQQQIDFHQLDDCLAGMQINDVFCCLGTTIKKAGSQKAFHEVDFVYPTEIAKLSIATGAEQFLLISALGANSGSAVFYNRVKGEVEEAIARYGFKGFYIFRPSLLLGKRRESRPAEKFGKKLFQWFSFVFKGVLQKYKPIESRAVAYAMVEVAKEQPLGKQIIESRQIQSIYDQR